jgi:hypothetical protein
MTLQKVLNLFRLSTLTEVQTVTLLKNLDLHGSSNSEWGLSFIIFCFSSSSRFADSVFLLVSFSAALILQLYSQLLLCGVSSPNKLV